MPLDSPVSRRTGRWTNMITCRVWAIGSCLMQMEHYRQQYMPACHRAAFCRALHPARRREGGTVQVIIAGAGLDGSLFDLTGCRQNQINRGGSLLMHMAGHCRVTPCGRCAVQDCGCGAGGGSGFRSGRSSRVACAGRAALQASFPAGASMNR